MKSTLLRERGLVRERRNESERVKRCVERGKERLTFEETETEQRKGQRRQEKSTSDLQKERKLWSGRERVKKLKRQREITPKRRKR